MTKEDFINYIEIIYPPYSNQALRLAVLKYLDDYDMRNLRILFGLVTKGHYVRLGTPCIASIDTIHCKFQNETGKSLKHNNFVSATAPVEENTVITDEEREDVLRELDDGYIKKIFKNND